jgi:acetyl-CoA C-acetyltransferase
MMDAARTPVIIGVGQVNDRNRTPESGLDPIGLMAAALRAADADAGGGWLADLDSLAVVRQISFPKLDGVPERLAAELETNPRLCYGTPSASGDSPILLLNEAANRIAAGEIEVAAVAGGEALRTAAQRAAAVSGADPSAYNPMRSGRQPRAPSYRHRYGLTAAADVYPLYENAGRAAYGQSLPEAQRESGEIWSRFSEVAAANPDAWIQRPMRAEEILTPSPDNRPISFPYTKFMVANSSVNQGAGFLVTSLALARAHGIPEGRLVYVGRGASAHEPEDVLARDRYDRSAGMTVTLQRVLDFNCVQSSELDLVELYSCFPCVPKMARRVLDWPLERPATVFGGLTFGGGPIGNYMSHAVACLARGLRGSDRKGLLFANGGLATHNHAIILSGSPMPLAGLPHEFDVQAEADALRGDVPPVVEDFTGPGVIESYTVLYARDGRPRFGVVVARNVAGERFLARVPPEDEAALAFLTDGRNEPVGAIGEAVAGPDGLRVWRGR